MTRVPVDPRLLIWARERAGLDTAALLHRFPKLAEWEAGARQPTLKQLEDFARAVHVPFGYLFFPEPPTESLPIPDFRTLDGRGIRQPSPDLLDTVRACRERQDWYRDYARGAGATDLPFVASATVDDSPEDIARAMRVTLEFDLESRAACRTWEDALRTFGRQAEAAGVLVMINSVVGNNNRRPLDPEEFRGFCLADSLAPLVFVNGADTKAAQMFTLAHELAHLWLGASAVSDLGARPRADARAEEVWCNAVAAEFLAPIDVVRRETSARLELAEALPRLTRRFKVSTLVVLRRLLDAGRIDRRTFDTAWEAQLDAFRQRARQETTEANFYNVLPYRFSRRFTDAVVASTFEGRILYRDALRMLGLSKTNTLERLGRETGRLP